MIDTKTNTRLGDRIPADSLEDVVLSADGRYLYAYHYGSSWGSAVWMIDTATRTTTGIPLPH
jgi:DNA-binding beta-propeller fold protein YncE